VRDPENEHAIVVDTPPAVTVDHHGKGNGQAGAQGPQGEKGDTGAQGPQGEKGDSGR
jgi:hypothetical protein